MTDGVILPHLVDMICTTVLPAKSRDIEFPGHGHSVLFIDTDHKLKVIEFLVQFNLMHIERLILVTDSNLSSANTIIY